jgi:cob(I)alamin adenosyltransferase
MGCFNSNGVVDECEVFNDKKSNDEFLFSFQNSFFYIVKEIYIFKKKNQKNKNDQQSQSYLRRSFSK